MQGGWNDMNAASMSYEESAGPESAVTGVRERLCGTTGTAARLGTPVQDENKLSSIVFQRHGCHIHAVCSGRPVTPRVAPSPA
jgi:hypothetical protein